MKHSKKYIRAILFTLAEMHNSKSPSSSSSLIGFAVIGRVLVSLKIDAVMISKQVFNKQLDKTKCISLTAEYRMQFQEQDKTVHSTPQFIPQQSTFHRFPQTARDHRTYLTCVPNRRKLRYVLNPEQYIKFSQVVVSNCIT